MRTTDDFFSLAASPAVFTDLHTDGAIMYL